MASVKALCEEIRRETKGILASEPKEIRQLYTAGILPYNAGAGGQYFGTLLFVNSDLRALGTLYLGAGILRALKDDDFTLVHCKKLLEYCNLREGTRFLAYCGFETLWSFTQQVFAMLEDIGTKSDLEALMNSYFNYIWILYGWSHHKFPWGLGTGVYRKRTHAELRQLGAMYSQAAGTGGNSK